MSDDGKMFWGLVLKPDKRYEQTVEEAFHVSKACVEPGVNAAKGVTSVFIEAGQDEFILTNLGKDVLADGLDLNFGEGEKICFRTSVSIDTVHASSTY